MSLCTRLIGGLFDGLDVLASFWQTPREVEWAKAAADGLAEREAEVESRSVCPTCDWAENPLCSSSYHPKTPAAGAGAEDDPRAGATPMAPEPARGVTAESPAPEFDWVTTAIPVIAGVLAEHKFLPIMGRCECPSLPRVADWQRWCEHVSPHIAITIQSDFLSTIYEDTTFAINAFSGDRPRPLADFPKHQNPRM